MEFWGRCFLNNVYPLYLLAHTSHGLQPLDNGIFNVLKGALNKTIRKYALLLDSSSVGKINFVRALKEAREAVSTTTIKNSFRHCGIYPMSRLKALKHQEIQPDKEKVAHDPTANTAVSSDINMATVLDLVRDGNREQKAAARAIGSTLQDLRSQVAILQSELEVRNEREQVQKQNRKRKSLPNPNQGFRSYAEIQSQDFTLQGLQDIRARKPEPKRRKSAPVVAAEEEEPEEAENNESEEEIVVQRAGRGGRTRRLPKRYLE